MALESEDKVYVGNVDVAAKKARDILLGKVPLDKIVDWATSFSLWPVHLTTSCCSTEFAATFGPRIDGEQFGALPWVGPRQTNLIIIEGTVTKKMACAVRLTWEQMPHPKFAIAMGACALDGGLFYNSYNIVKPWQVLPIDIYIPGCPPRPEGVARAIVELQRKIRSRKIASGWVKEGWRPDREPLIPTEDLCGWAVKKV
ncbi:NADH-quinone oxidoreductase subunit B [Aeropyrum camini]|uniref:NuoB-like protein n=1 Tax=Aeropyrum camini SY1 = JCM 12091 TaxID=1198449 RepID=U3TD62_9CREN|nr:NADH-quinone oxidoreductase subunit B [Aeropyrum camini]BAN90366.1 NuoB-like protein [Aeropyrum camini SY1 = JCM 12091]